MYSSLCFGGGSGGGGGLFPKAVVHILNECIAACAVVVVVLECTCYNGCTRMVCMVVIAGDGDMRWLYVHGIVAVWCGGGHMW